jgi:hypothetical protein
MASTVARLNIERFRRKLTEETDERKLRMLQRLLTEVETKLAELWPKQSSVKNVSSRLD